MVPTFLGIHLTGLLMLMSPAFRHWAARDSPLGCPMGFGPAECPQTLAPQVLLPECQRGEWVQNLHSHEPASSRASPSRTHVPFSFATGKVVLLICFQSYDFWACGWQRLAMAAPVSRRHNCSRSRVTSVRVLIHITLFNIHIFIFLSKFFFKAFFLHVILK